MGARRSGRGPWPQGGDPLSSHGKITQVRKQLKLPPKKVKEREVLSFGGIRKGLKNLGKFGIDLEEQFELTSNLTEKWQVQYKQNFFP